MCPHSYRLSRAIFWISQLNYLLCDDPWSVLKLTVCPVFVLTYSDSCPTCAATTCPLSETIVRVERQATDTAWYHFLMLRQLPVRHMNQLQLSTIRFYLRICLEFRHFYCVCFVHTSLGTNEQAYDMNGARVFVRYGSGVCTFVSHYSDLFDSWQAVERKQKQKWRRVFFCEV